MWVLYLLPKNLISRLVGCLMDIKWPAPIGQFLIGKFAGHYKINLDEAEHPITHYQSIGDFFVRGLKLSKRPLANFGFVHPADAVITECGEIKDGKLIQAKGLLFSLNEFVGETPNWEKYLDGFFATYYLCPTDYHRVHSAVSGNITRVRYIPGNLWPVNGWSTASIQNLFSINERVVVEIQSVEGDIAMVFVGATNVGKISLKFLNGFFSNTGSSAGLADLKIPENLSIEKGAELGRFHMGSTVVVLCSKEYSKATKIQNQLGSLKGQQVRVRSFI